MPDDPAPMMQSLAKVRRAYQSWLAGQATPKAAYSSRPRRIASATAAARSATPSLS